MYKLLLIIALLITSGCSPKLDQQTDIEQIKQVLYQSAEDWTNGDIEGFMEAYWKSDKLQFVGTYGITYGWQQTFENYKKGYPTKDHTGKLTFEILSTEFLARNLYTLIGTYQLERKIGESNGIFSLIFKKIDNKWVIISDHSE
jgi:ketosteroid isomerase-like protein